MIKKLLPIYLIALIIVSLFVIYGCGNPTGGGGGGSSDGGGGASMITLTGQITGSGFTTSSLSQIKKVVIFNTNSGFWVANVSGGKFTGQAEAGKPVGLIFAGENVATTENGFIGYLTMGSSIDSIPLNLVSSLITAIDLQTIRLSSGIATSENHFISDEVSSAKISNSDVLAMSFGNELFSSIIKNPDADHNGEIDILETPSKYYRPYMLYFVTGGTFVGASGDGVWTPPVNPSTVIYQHRFNLDVYKSDGGLPDNIIVEANNILHNCSFDAGNSVTSSTRHLYYYSNAVNNVPWVGTYEVTGLTGTLSFDVTSKAIATDHLAIAVPTVTVSGGNVTQISWTYEAGSAGGDLTDPRSLVEAAGIQINNGSSTRIYDTQLILSPTDTTHAIQSKYILSGSTLPWTSVNNIGMAYNDVFGNHIVVTWYK